MHWEQTFHDRRDGGRALAAKLAGQYANRADVVVLGLPSGGLPVASEVAHALRAPLDALIVRKLGVPGQEQLAMGALERERRELERREREYLGDRQPVDVRGKTIMVVDDGIATGATTRAAVAALRQRGAGRIVAAVPHASPESCAELGQLADERVCCQTPSPYIAVGAWYDVFPQTSDAEVKQLLGEAAQHRAVSDAATYARRRVSR